jgi:hypothetical protein
MFSQDIAAIEPNIEKNNLPETLYKLCLLGIILKLSGDFLKLINSD